MKSSFACMLILLTLLLTTGSGVTTWQRTKRLPQPATRHGLSAPRSALATSSTTAPAAVTSAKTSLPLAFVENRGQADARAAFVVQGRDTAAYFTAQGMTLSLTQQNTSERRQRWNLKLAFVGANPAVKPVGKDLAAAQVSYFNGAEAKWRAGIRTYSSIVYPELWPGIDLVYSGTTNRLKYEFIVRPGADPQQIRLAYRGTSAPLTVNQTGQLQITTPLGVIPDDKPVAVQGRGKRIKADFVVDEVAADGSQQYSFRVGRYDQRKTLVIDPAVLVYSGFIGGSGDEEGHSIAVDNAGNSYITGVTTSTEASFPDVAGPDVSYNGRTDAFVAKIKADGSGLLYAGYIGGDGDEAGHGIAVDAGGNAYITGWTTSTEGTFPVLGGLDATFNGAIDAFVAKINPTGTALVYCGYVGGDDDDEGMSIAVDSSGRAYVTGLTASTEATFPTRSGPKLTFGGAIDAFVARVKADGSGLEYAGYLGGSGDDQGRSIAVDASGNAYVAGVTSSTEATFPMVGPLGASAQGGTDVFVAKITASGTALSYAGFIGGSGIDEAYGIAVDGGGNAYVTGRTASTEATFPVLVGPDLSFNGGSDAFVVKVKADGSGLSYAGYIGGNGDEEGFSIAVDSGGNAYVTGRTTSNETTFPKNAAPDLTLSGASDAFVAKINPSGMALVYAGYIGGAGAEEGFGIAVDVRKFTYLTGRTTSSAATFPLLVGPALTSSGAADVFVVKLTDTTDNPPNPVPAIAFLNPNVALAGGQAFTLTVTGTNFTQTSIVRWNGADRVTIFKSGTQLEAAILATDLTASGTASVTVFNPTPSGGTSNVLTFLIDTALAFEADVAPRPNGNMNGAVTIGDWTQLGRFVVGLDTPAAGSEFQRADCAPKTTLGDGKLSVADWVQAGRYAAGLDPVMAAGGPTAAAFVSTQTVAQTEAELPRTIRALSASFQRSQISSLPIQLEAQGNENAAAFSLNFDPARLTFVDAKPGTDAGSATAVVNAAQAANGKIGVALALGAGQSFAVGTQTLLTVRFIPRGGDGELTTGVSFGDQLLTREVADLNAAAITSVSYTGAAITITGKAVATVSAANYVGGEQAAESIVSAFGSQLAAFAQAAASLPLPFSLGGSQVIVKDSKGVERFAPLFYASPTQINFQLPAGTAEGVAALTIFSGAGVTSTGLVMIGKVAPALFSADASGTGVAAGSALLVRADGARTEKNLARYDDASGKFIAEPIDIGSSGDQMYLTLYGTGCKNRSDLAQVKVKIGGVDARVEYAGAQGFFAGLDQINVKLPRNLSLHGEVDIELLIEEKAANRVKVSIK